jgi:hypothetical protein
MLCGISVVFNLLGDVFALVSISTSAALRAGRCLWAFNRRKPLVTSSIPAAVQRSAIAALRQRFTLRQRLRTVPNFNLSISPLYKERRCLENALPPIVFGSDYLTDAEWGRVEPIVASANSDGRNRTIDVRKNLN